MEDLTLLFERYERYYKHALEAQSKNAFADAKLNFTKAAELMYTIAMKSPQNLKDIRLEKAKKLIEIAEGLKPAKVNKPQMDKQEDKKEIKPTLSNEKITFDDVVGLDDAKDYVRTQVILPIKYPAKYETYKKELGGGLLMYGPPGTGKTTFAKAIASEVDATFFYIKGSDISDKFVGESEKNVASLFESAKKEERAIVFIDDMDSLFLKRGIDHHNDKVINEFLQHIDGFQGRNPNVFFLGATNRPWALDSAITRPGRFSRLVYIPLPNQDARFKMFQRNLKDVPVNSDLDYVSLVENTENYSGADIRALCEEAKVRPLMKFIESDVVAKIENADFEKALQSVKSSIDLRDVHRFEEYNQLRGYKQKHVENSLDNKEESLPKIDIEEPSNILIDHDKNIELGIDNLASIQFVLNDTFNDQIYLEVDTRKYVCTKKLNQWTCEGVFIDHPGLHEILILHKDEKISTFDIEFTRGIKENNLGF